MQLFIFLLFAVYIKSQKTRSNLLNCKKTCIKIHESELDTSRDSKSLMKRSLADIKLALFSSLKISYFGSLHKEIDQRMPIYNQQFSKTPRQVFLTTIPQGSMIINKSFRFQIFIGLALLCVVEQQRQVVNKLYQSHGNYSYYTLMRLHDWQNMTPHVTLVTITLYSVRSNINSPTPKDHKL